MLKQDNREEYNKRIGLMQDILNELVLAEFTPDSEFDIVGSNMHIYKQVFSFNSFRIELKMDMYFPKLLMTFDIHYYQDSKHYIIGKCYSMENSEEIFDSVYFTDKDKIEYERIPEIILEAIVNEKVLKKLQNIYRMNNLVYLLN